jgi:hypothetical protein
MSIENAELPELVACDNEENRPAELTVSWLVAASAWNSGPPAMH